MHRDGIEQRFAAGGQARALLTFQGAPLEAPLAEAERRLDKEVGR